MPSLSSEWLTMLFSDGRTDASIALSLSKGVEKRKVRAGGNREEKKTEHLVGRNGIFKRHQVGEDESVSPGGFEGRESIYILFSKPPTPTPPPAAGLRLRSGCCPVSRYFSLSPLHRSFVWFYPFNGVLKTNRRPDLLTYWTH